MIKIIEILTQNRRDFNTKIIEILTLKSWFQPDFFKISTRNVRCLDKPEIPPPPRLQIKDTEYFISNMVTILNICVISFFLFSLEKISSAQKKNESHGFFLLDSEIGIQNHKLQRKFIFTFYSIVCVCVCVWAGGGGGGGG